MPFQSRSIRALLLEDNPGDARLISELLRDDPRATYQITHAPTRKDALATIERLGPRAFDIALIDLGLPDADRLEAFQHVADAAPALPIIVLTGLDDNAVATAAVQAGAQDFLIKGESDGPAIGRAIHYAIERHRANLEFSLLHTLTLAISAADTTENALQNALVETSRITGWRDAEAWIIDPDAHATRLVARAATTDITSHARPLIIPIHAGKQPIGALTFAADDHHDDDRMINVVRDALAPLQPLLGRRRAAEQLNNRERQLRLITDAIPGLVAYIDPDLRYRFANKSYHRLIGVDPTAIIGTHVRDIADPDVYRTIEPNLQRTLRGERVTFSFQFNSPRVGQRSLYATYLPHRDEHGIVQGIIAVTNDVTTIEQAERAIRESERRLRQTFERTALLALILTPDARVDFCNARFLETTGWDQQNITHQDWFSRCIPADRANAMRHCFNTVIANANANPQARDQGPFDNADWPLLTRDGERREISWHTALIRGANARVVGVTALGVDVTELRKTQAILARHRTQLEQQLEQRTAELEESHDQLRAADRLLVIGTLAAGIGHDMRNIVLPTRCRLDALQAMPLPDNADEEINAIRQWIDHLDELSVALRQLARDPERAGSEGESTELQQWWQQIKSIAERSVPSTIRFQTDINLNQPTPVAVASHRLSQALINLLVNAAEACDQAGTVRVNIHRDQKTNHAIVAVSDTGVGMPTDVQRRAFDPFFTTKARGLSTGLGLAVVHGAAVAAGGKATIHSTPGKGTIITLQLPIIHQPSQNPTPTQKQTTVFARVIGNDQRAAAFARAAATAAGATLLNDETPPEHAPLVEIHTIADPATNDTESDPTTPTTPTPNRPPPTRTVLYAHHPTNIAHTTTGPEQLVIIDPTEGLGALRSAVIESIQIAAHASKTISPTSYSP